jgi:hypothetical protein
MKTNEPVDAQMAADLERGYDTRWSKTVTGQTALREYSVVYSWGKYQAYYQPRNTKTGKVWQATRRINDIRDTMEEAKRDVAAEMEASGK